jgi:hypothetical protein
MHQAEDDTVAFLRQAKDETLVVVAHGGTAARAPGPIRVSHGGIPHGMEFFELFTGTSTRVEQGALPVPSMRTGVALWRASL